MTEEELVRFFTALKTTWPSVGEALERKVVRQQWVDSFVSADAQDVRMALRQWINTHTPDRIPTINDLALSAIDFRRDRLTAQAQADNAAAAKAIREEKVPTSIDNPTDRVWVEFHLHWTGVGLNSITAEQNRHGKRHQPKFPWERLRQAYKELATEHHELAIHCERAVSRIAAKG